MGRVLVDEVEAGRPFGDDVGGAGLAEGAQDRDAGAGSDGCEVSIAARR